MSLHTDERRVRTLISELREEGVAVCKKRIVQEARAEVHAVHGCLSEIMGHLRYRLSHRDSHAPVDHLIDEAFDAVATALHRLRELVK